MRILLNLKIKGKNNPWVLLIYLLDTNSFSLKCQLSKQWMIIVCRGYARHCGGHKDKQGGSCPCESTVKHR